MKYIIISYNTDPAPLLKYTDDFLIYDRSDTKCPMPDKNVIKTENRGHVDFSKLTYLVDNYFDLPEVFFWGKANVFPRHMTEEEFVALKDRKEFTPLMTMNHKTYSDERGQVCYYEDGWYWERNDSWYLNTWPAIHAKSFKEWADIFQLPNPDYIPFCPGGNYILTREKVHKYSVDYYDKMRSMLPYCQLPGEAQMAERSYGLMWK